MLAVTRVRAIWVCAAAAVCLGGCNGPSQRFYAWNQRDLRTEARTYEFHDPYPDGWAGPDTEARPRSFEEPRSDTRQDYDLRLLESMAGGGGLLGFSRRSASLPTVSPIAPAVPIQSVSTAR
jgi:hypothetical protein